MGSFALRLGYWYMIACVEPLSFFTFWSVNADTFLLAMLCSFLDDLIVVSTSVLYFHKLISGPLDESPRLKPIKGVVKSLFFFAYYCSLGK